MTKPFYMLDTNACSAAIRGNDGIDQRFQALVSTDWCISAVAHSELRYGLALKPEAVRLARLVEGFIQIWQR